MNYLTKVQNYNKPQLIKNAVTFEKVRLLRFLIYLASYGIGLRIVDSAVSGYCTCCNVNKSITVIFIYFSYYLRIKTH